MTINAALVKELRSRTGAGMMDCKKALEESKGDMDLAIDVMRKSGVAKVAKKAGRIAADGMLVIRQSDQEALILEINAETDFVAKQSDFQGFANQVADAILLQQPENVEALLQCDMAGNTIEELRHELVTKVGENINIRRFHVLVIQGVAGAYLHGLRIGALVDMNGGDIKLAKDIAMHITAAKPHCVSEDQIDKTMLARERDIIKAQLAESSKPPEIVEKIITGRMNKLITEITLLGQPYIKDDSMTVKQLLQEAGASVNKFIRYELGEGIEKQQDDFVAEVMAQANKG